MPVETTVACDPTLIARIANRAHAQMAAMIHFANHREGIRPGDPKVGGHPAACASAMHILGALHLAVREVHDYVCCKPHASPMDHAYHFNLGVFRDEKTRKWLSDEESAQIMRRLRKFPEAGAEQVFQSYHARPDPDSFHMLPSGSVGIPPVVSVYLALAHRYARDHNYRVPPKAHFWSLIGDSEFREGSLLEAMPEVAERLLGNVTWIIDYNRQNLDGTRIPNERGLDSTDCDRIENTAVANGWKVIQVRHGSFRRELFERKGGEALRELFEKKLSDYHYQLLIFKRDAAEIRKDAAAAVPGVKKLLESLSDEDVLRAFNDVGGHDTAQLIDALKESKEDELQPCLIVVHTIKGWGMDCFANPSNHNTLPSEKEVAALLEAEGLTLDDPFQRFDPSTEEGAFLEERRALFKAGTEAHWKLREENRQASYDAIQAVGGLPDQLEIDTSLFPTTHTQWMWGQVAAKMVRIGTVDQSEEDPGGRPKKPLTELEARWKPAADYVLTMSPDVGTSTQIAPTMNKRVYGPNFDQDDEHGEFDAHHPELAAHPSAITRHIRFEIAEANCMSAAGAFGKMGHYTGLPFFPVMTIYDFFIKRALDQLYYNLYWGSEFVIIGTPSGVTLSSEGAQHSWKSDIQIPNLITWEPLFAVEMEWILADAIRRQLTDQNEGRRGVLVRAVTRGVKQALFKENLVSQARFKQDLPAGTLLKPAGGGPEWGDAVDESTLPALSEAEVRNTIRENCLLGGYFLVNWEGYAGYEPGDNVVNVFVMGSVGTEALEASRVLLEMGIFANVVVVTSPELMLGILGEQNEYDHLKNGLGITGDLHATTGAGTTEAGLLSLAGRRVPCVAVCDGEAGLLDNIGSIVGVKQITLAVRRFSKCGRPDQVFEMHGLDCNSVVEACGRALAETATEELRIPADLADRLARRSTSQRPNWRELWPTTRQG